MFEIFLSAAIYLTAPLTLAEQSAKQKIKFLEVPASTDSFSILFREGDKVGIVSHYSDTIVVKTGSGEHHKIWHEELSYSRLDEAGIVDVDNDGMEEVFFSRVSGGSGVTTFHLFILSPVKVKLLGIAIDLDHDPSAVYTPVSETENYFGKDLTSERMFLEALKYDYGFVSEEEANADTSNPWLAYYYWVKDNGQLWDGPMKLRKFSGKHLFDHSSYKAQLKVGDITFRSFWKAGVVAYNEIMDQEFVVFFPTYYYSGAGLIVNVGPYLIIGTAGEGLAMINLSTNHLKRIYLEGKNSYVESLDTSGNQIIVNHCLFVPLPDF